MGQLCSSCLPVAHLRPGCLAVTTGPCSSPYTSHCLLGSPTPAGLCSAAPPVFPGRRTNSNHPLPDFPFCPGTASWAGLALSLGQWMAGVGRVPCHLWIAVPGCKLLIWWDCQALCWLPTSLCPRPRTAFPQWDCPCPELGLVPLVLPSAGSARTGILDGRAVPEAL